MIKTILVVIWFNFGLFIGHMLAKFIYQEDFEFWERYAEAKTGHWINRHIIANKTFDMIVCSECGEEFSFDAETGISEYNYCPNCGAKMED